MTTPDFRAIFEAVPGCHAVIDLVDGSILAVSDDYARTLGLGRDVLVGVTATALPLPRYAAALGGALARVRAHGHGDQLARIDLDTDPREWRASTVPLRGPDGAVRIALHRLDEARGAILDAAHADDAALARARLAALVDASADAIISKTLDGIVTSWNPGATAIFGYAADEMLGQSLLRIFPPDRVDEEATILERLRRGDPIERFESVRRRKDGTDVAISFTVSPIHDDAGRITGVSTSARDLSGQRRDEAARASLEVRAAAVLDAVLDGILVIDERGTVSTFNRGAERIFGYAASEVVGQNIRMLMPEPDRGAHDQYLERYRDTGIAKVIGIGREVVGARKDGSRVALDLSVIEMRVDGARCYTGVVRDLTERKAAEAALARSREVEGAARIDRIGARVLSVLNHHDGAASPIGDVLRVLADEAGYGPLAYFEFDEWAGELTAIARTGVAADAAPVLKIGSGQIGLAAARREARFVDATEGRIGHAVGLGRMSAATVFAIPLVHRDKLLGVIAGASGTPLTAGDRSWLTLVVAQVAVGLHSIGQFHELKRLSAELNDRSRRIEAQNRDLAKASRLKSEFLASMSHELRTPLNAIIGFSEVLKDGLLGELAPDQRDYIGEVYRSGRHLLSLINDILDLSKIEAGKMELVLEPVDIETIVANAMTVVKEAAVRGGVSTSRVIASDLGEVMADVRRVRQVLYNLLSNAVKFTPRGGWVRVEATRQGDAIELAVADSGIGIAAHDLPRLFQPFEQLDGGLDRQFEGTGLGLVMVKNIAELHGGSVGVESAPGAGSRFWVRLPLVAQPRTGAPTTPPFARDPAPYVLVVDGDPAPVGAARRWLEREGYAVQSAPDIDAAWTAIQARRPELILLGVQFEERAGGRELRDRLRTSPMLATIPVVAMAIAAEADRASASPEAGLAVLEKPPSGADLASAVASFGLTARGAGPAPYVLVIDDDPSAVEHVALRLEQHGIVVARAYTGRDGLAALAADPFDAVVLDLLLPDMRGVDVIHAIRRNTATTLVPILVMTAMSLDAADRAALEHEVEAVLAKATWDDGQFLQVMRNAIRAAHRRALETTWADASARARATASPRAPGRVLVLARPPTARELLRRFLDEAGFDVAAIASAAEADGQFGGRRPDLIALDLGDARAEDLAVLGTSTHLRGVPVLLIAPGGPPERAAALDADAVLTKPVVRSELLAVVGRLFAEREGARPYVLVVDDDPLAAMIICAYFGDLDEPIEVVRARGGREALDLMRSRRPDLLILDLLMPEMSGFEVLSRLRREPAWLELPVIILTAKQLTAADHGLLASSVQAVLGKAVAGRGDVLEHARRLLAARVGLRRPGAA
ncbi:MAG: PAS domain S-box protein [Deltaproteobacteria bacterium]|nr:PAS domain S-box protein [Deltaproteobacteria bacterium]